MRQALATAIFEQLVEDKRVYTAGANVFCFTDSADLEKASVRVIAELIGEYGANAELKSHNITVLPEGG